MKDRLCRFNLDVPRWIRRYVYPHKSIDKLTDLLALFRSLAGYVLRKFHIKLHTEEHSARSTDYSLIRKPTDAFKLNRYFVAQVWTTISDNFALRLPITFLITQIRVKRRTLEEKSKCVISWNPRTLISSLGRPRKLLITKLEFENVSSFLFFFFFLLSNGLTFPPVRFRTPLFFARKLNLPPEKLFHRARVEVLAKFRNLMRNQTGSF